jgi:hypothetical protein
MAEARVIAGPYAALKRRFQGSAGVVETPLEPRALLARGDPSTALLILFENQPLRSG